MSEAIDEGAVEESAVEEVIEEGSEEVSEESSEIVSEESESEEVQADTQEELKDEIEDAIEDGATEEDVKDMIREFELKVNGKTITKKVDLNDTEAMVRDYQIAEANKGGMQRAREIEKLYEQELTRLKERPWEVMKDLGIDIESLNEDFITNRVEEMKKSPDQVAMETMQKELTAAREREAKMEESQKASETARLQSEAASELNAQMDEVLSAHETLPNSPKVRERVAEAMLWAMENAAELGIDANALHARDVLPSVEQEMKREMQGFMQDMPAELMEAYIGKNNLDKLRQNRLKAAKKAPKSSKVAATAKSVIKEERSTEKTVNSRDFFRNL